MLGRNGVTGTLRDRPVLAAFQLGARAMTIIRYSATFRTVEAAAHLQVSQLQRTSRFPMTLPSVSYIEVSLGRCEVLHARSQLFDPLPITLSDLSSELHRVSPDVGQIIEDIRHAVAAGGGTVVHRLVRVAGENWLNCTVDISYDAFLNDTHDLIFIESLQAEQQARFEWIGGLAGLHAVMSVLRVQQLHVINGEIALDTEHLTMSSSEATFEH
jgi:hypothetical protein